MGEERATLARNNGRTSHDTPSEKRPELVQLPTGHTKGAKPRRSMEPACAQTNEEAAGGETNFPPAAWRFKCRAPNARIVAHANGRQCLIRSPFAGRFQVGGWPLGRGRAAVPLRTNVVELEEGSGTPATCTSHLCGDSERFPLQHAKATRDKQCS